ncbi:nucleotide exchange factor GrpE [Priestia megaterium]|uniref:nucleotide exchange factor GrpE n=1 Tax=Priestia megaterium TaxID=1404 RepID=UPI0021D656CC|nr:nucleotide exchange factor GrpE [Priestia megaterium]MCU7745586.1 nucleotide exchange factor GrpE [Priestia megaterium]
MIEKSGLVQELLVLQQQYEGRQKELEKWKAEFDRLSQETEQFMFSFHEKYEKTNIDEEFTDELKEKLENRLEGIRLSDKSVSRLIRRLNPEKEIETVTSEFILAEKIGEQINKNRQVDSETEEVVPDSAFDLQNQDDVETTAEENHSEALEVDENNTQEHDIQNQPIEDVSIEKEAEVTEETESGTYSESEAALLKEAIRSNQNVLEEVNERIEVAEKRFVTFMEKGVAPIIDGLYSGSNYANDLLVELEQQNHEQFSKVKEWLTIYPRLMKDVEALFNEFHVELYIPQPQDTFDEYKHEPIGVVEDEELEDEQIKEVVRYGLIYQKELFNQSHFLIRPAQVIVVKNKSKDLVEENRGNVE